MHNVKSQADAAIGIVLSISASEGLKQVGLQVAE